MHVDEFIFNCCVSSMISEDAIQASEECAMNIFSIDENKIRDANGIIFAEAITCYKCTFCGKMFAAMEVVLTHYQSNHRCSVIPLLKGMHTFAGNKTMLQRSKHTGSDSLMGHKRKKMPIVSSNHKKPKLTFTKTSNAHNNNNHKKNKSQKKLKDINSKESSSMKKLRLFRENSENKQIQQQEPIKLVYKKSKGRYRCTFPGCEKRFNYHSNLISHRRNHHDIKSFTCNWGDCEFKCSDKAGLEFHKKTHSGENPYRCSWPGCNESFPDPNAKDQHLQKEHIGDRTLPCDYPDCIAKFKSASERDQHKLIHFGKRISPTTPVRVTRQRLAAISESESEESVEESDDNDDEEAEQENNGKEEVNTRSDTESTVRSDENSTKSQFSDLKSDAKEVKNDPKTESTTDIDKNSKTNSKKSKPGKPPKKSIDKIFRCDFPGCRKTFPSFDALKEHENETHKTSDGGRSRYERRCKGNLYYKI